MSDVAQFETVAWSWARNRIGQGLRERYAVPRELPPRLGALVRKLEAAEGAHPSRTLFSRLDALEGNYLLRHAPPVEPRCAAPSDRNWPLCTWEPWNSVD